MNTPNINGALDCLNFALSTINGWALDEQGRALVHPDVIIKAIRAAMFNLEVAQPESKEGK